MSIWVSDSESGPVMTQQPLVVEGIAIMKQDQGSRRILMNIGYLFCHTHSWKQSSCPGMISCRTDQLNCARAVLLYVNMTCWTCHYHIPSHCAAQHKSLYIRYKGFTLAHVANHTCSCMWLGRVIALRSMDRRAHGHWHWIFIFYCYVLVPAITFANQDALIHPIRA